MNDPLLEDVLEAYAPRGGRDDLDWADVVRRAAEGREDRSRRGRPLAVAVLAAGLLLLVLATPAFGLRQALLDLVGREDVSFGDAEEAPLVTKREFADLALGAPPGMDPQVLPNQTRRVVLETPQRRRVLFVAPTRRGGFCYLLEGAGGGCQRNDGGRLPPVTISTFGGRRAGEPPRVLGVSGTVLDERVTRVTVEFAGGDEVDLPFVWISAPIRAGFFAYDVPRARQTEPRGPRAVVGRDGDGNVVHRERGFHIYRLPELPEPPRVAQTPAGRTLPAEPPVAPTPPLQRASHRGATVTVGANGAARFDSSGLEPRIRALLDGHSASFGCFRITTQHGATYARGYGVSGRFADRVGLRLHGLGALDGCEIQGSYGHRWPDRLGSHSAVELAFSEQARRYFLDRAAARDLALFVRKRDVQQIRRLAGDRLVGELERSYGGGIVRLRNVNGRPPAGKIGYLVSEGRVTFVRFSERGRRFFVAVEKGKIAQQNLGQLAMVF